MLIFRGEICIRAIKIAFCIFGHLHILSRSFGLSPPSRHDHHDHLLFWQFGTAPHWHHIALSSRTWFANIPDHHNDDCNDDDDDDKRNDDHDADDHIIFLLLTRNTLKA